MDPLTQAVFGVNAALLARGKQISPKAALVLGAAAGMAPDLDVLIRSSFDPLLSIEFHRFFTHSIFFVPLGGWVVAILLRWLLRRYTTWSLGSFGRWYCVSALAMLTHAPLDMCTSYGTSFLWPLSDARLDWSVVAVIDPLVTLPMLLLLTWGWLKSNRYLYGCSAVYVLCYLALGAYNHHVAQGVTLELARSRGHDPESIEVKPAMFVNFLWRTIYDYQDHYYVDAVRLKLSGDHRVYPGTSVAVFDRQQDLPQLPMDTQHSRDIQRFERFSQGMNYRLPDRPMLIADIRYSMVPNQIDPLWGIELNQQNPDGHVSYVVFRDLTPAKRMYFWRMLLGDAIENVE